MMSEITTNNNLRVPDKKGFFLGIRSKMLIYFGSMIALMLLTFVLVDIYGIPFTTFRGVYKKEQAEVFRHLSLVADLKKERLLRWMKERMNDTSVLAENTLISSCTASLLLVFNENFANGVRGEALLAELQKEGSYQILMQQMKLVKETYGVYDKVQIADALTGIIIASTRNEDVGMDLSLHNCFTNVIQTGNHDAVTIEKDQLSGNLGLFVSHAIYRPDDVYKISSVLIMHINPDDLIRPMLHTGGGLGQTGEVLLVNYDAKILTTLKYPLADGTIALPLEYQIKARPATLAAQGEEGIITTKDYRGEKVLAAFRHARITSELGWGLVIKRDMIEVFAPVRESLYYRILIGSICALMMFVLTTLIARRLTRPIQHLSEVAKEIKEGNLNAQAQITTSDEIGVLANMFNEMLNSIKMSQEEIKQHRDCLAEMVEKRTSELTATNEKLNREIVEREKAEVTLRESEEGFRSTFQQAAVGIAHVAPNGRFLKINKRFCDIAGYTEEEMLKLSFQNVTHPDDIDADAAFVNQMLDGEINTYTMEKRYIKKDDTLVWINLTVSLVHDNSGGPKYFISVIEDITGRVKTEKQIFRQRTTLDAINKIFKEALTCKTEEEVALRCLSLAQELTDSQFGFYGELNRNGLFDTIALSDPGWDACRIPESNAVNQILNMKIHGIYGSTLRGGKSLIVNSPASHSDRIGIPEGHPPLNRFLGIPLKRAGKTIGMIALGNKESDYNMSDQVAVEALSAAFVETLVSKRAEIELQKSYAELENRVAERTEELTKANANLEEKNKEYERFNELFVNREFRIKELRDRIKKLEG